MSTPTTYLEELELELADAIANIDPTNVEWDDFGSALYLTGASTKDSRESDRLDLGLLAQPGNGVLKAVDAGDFALFGADNGFYGLGSKADPTPEQDAAAVERWLRWIVAEVAPRQNACLFATVPDVLNWLDLDGRRIPVGDAEGTLRRYSRLARIVRALGIPAALVAQDGLRSEGDELVAGDARIAWDEVDVLFVGGSDDFKLGPEAAALCREARARGLWVHVGRVNTIKRTNLVADYCDSADGTLLAFGSAANFPRLVKMLDVLAGAGWGAGLFVETFVRSGRPELELAA